MQIRNIITGSIAGLLLLSAPAFARITTGCGDGAVGFSNGEASVVLHESGDATFINEASGRRTYGTWSSSRNGDVQVRWPWGSSVYAGALNHQCDFMF